MSDVKAQYEAYPYPERDPADENKRLITGSPSHPLELDHFLFAGKRDWRKPLRALVAGGGTGDGLIQLAATMAAAGRPCDITYIDLSRAAREVAEARAAVRHLDNITFVTGSLMQAPELGAFDYIDCCGVLHHLPEPQAGFDALARALTPGGGIGLMVYAPYGRSGVYPLQAGFGALLAGLAPEQKLARARQIFKRLPATHPFKCNPHLGDHEQSDAGFYDLLLHSQDRAFTVTELNHALAGAGLELVNFTQPALYDLSRLLPKDAPGAGGDRIAAMAIAEQLRGTIKTHVAYAVRAGRAGVAEAKPTDMALVPQLKGVGGPQLARAVAGRGQISINLGPETQVQPLPKQASALIAAIDGRRSLAAIAAQAGLDHFAFQARWRPIDRALAGWGLLLYAQPL